MRAAIFAGLVALCLSLSACCHSAFCMDAQAGSGQILTRLSNGLTVYILPDRRFPLVCTRLYVRTGSANENPAQAGISHLLEHMVFKGTKSRPKGGIARAVEELGGYLNAATSFDRTWYITDMPAAHWKEGMDVVKEMAFEALLDPAELESEKDVVVSELQRGEDSPRRKLFENLQVAGLRNTPYGRPIIGFENTIRSVTAEDLRAYVHQWYQPQNMLLLVAGNIDAGEVLAYAQTLFGSLENHGDLNVPEPFDIHDAANGSEQIAISRGPWSKVYLGISWPAPGIRDARSIELDLLAFLLGGDATSLLEQKYRYELQLVDSISVDNMSLAQAGLFTITAQLDADKVGPFWEQLTRDLSTLGAQSFTPKALETAKLNLEDSIDRTRETLNGLASWEGTVQFELGGQQGADNLRFVQRNATLEQIGNAVTSWLVASRARVRIIAPTEAELPDFAQVMNVSWPQAGEAKTTAQTAEATAREIVELDKGCQLILIPDHTAPYVSIRYMMAGGNSILSADQQGLAALTARMLTDGSGNKNKLALERWLSERAASLSAGAGLQTFGISLTGHSRFNADYFQLLNEVLRLPRFEPAELKREVDEMKSALVQRMDQPVSFMFARVNPFLFPDGQPYGFDGLGSQESLDRFNVLDVKNFWTRQRTQPWALAIAGDFDRDAAIAFARTLPLATESKFTFAAPKWGTAHELALTLPGRAQAHLMQIFPTVEPTSPDAPRLMLLEAILSGQSGVLFSRLRDDAGLGYTVTAFNRSMPRAGFMAFYIGTVPEKMAEAEKGFAEVIAGLKTDLFPEKELEAGVNRMRGEYERGLQSLAARAGEAVTDAILGYPQDFGRQQIEKAASATPEELRELARRFLVDPYNVTLVP